MEYINLENPAVLEAKGLSLVWDAYAKFASREEIMEVGFNKYSGYVYIALEYGIQIVSAFGQDVEYIVYDYITGEEFFLDSYEEAENKLELINLDRE